MDNIDAINISVIVQGAINKTVTLQCLKSIRKYLPEAEIILSTWEGSDVSQLCGLYDILVLNKDPQAVVFDDKKNKLNNLNRILVSSKNGINAATRKYVLRLRSDLVLKNNNILKLTDEFEVRKKESSLFKNKIFAYEVFSMKYDFLKENKQRMLFHISDWCHFGLKEDLQEMFNLPLVEEPDFSRHFDVSPKVTFDIYKTRLWKMSPEQYFTSANAAKVFKGLKFENYLDITPENIRISEDFIINNFRVFSQKEWGIYSLKEQYKNVIMFANPPFTYYTKIEQLLDYKKYCNPSAKVPNIDFWESIYKKRYFSSFRKHCIQLVFCNFSRKPSELLSVISYFLKFLYNLIKE